MKALPFTIPKRNSALLLFQRDRGTKFYDQFHQHEAVQISMILAGEGELIAGDRMRRFKQGDCFVFGSFMPHLFKSEPRSESEVEMISLFFVRSDFNELVKIEEIQALEHVLNELEFGCSIESHYEEILQKFTAIEHSVSIERVIHFFTMLELIQTAKRTPLSSTAQRKMMTENEGKRMQKVLNFAMNSLANQITLEEVAAEANMTTNAFCRYFKQRTNQSFFQFLIKLRIENACSLLVNREDLSISAVSELSGFMNLSNFNRKFKAEKGVTPSAFRRQMRG